MELEQEQLAWLQCAKVGRAAWLPEIHLIWRTGRQEFEPRPVCNGDEQPNHLEGVVYRPPLCNNVTSNQSAESIMGSSILAYPVVTSTY